MAAQRASALAVAPVSALGVQHVAGVTSAALSVPYVVESPLTV
ncbi:hypothetical protein AB0L41_47710 [Amycolatopsis mediterranei]